MDLSCNERLKIPQKPEPLVAQQQLVRTAAAGALQPRLVMCLRQLLRTGWKDGVHAHPDRRTHARFPAIYMRRTINRTQVIAVLANTVIEPGIPTNTPTAMVRSSPTNWHASVWQRRAPLHDGGSATISSAHTHRWGIGHQKGTWQTEASLGHGKGQCKQRFRPFNALLYS